MTTVVGKEVPGAVQAGVVGAPDGPVGADGQFVGCVGCVGSPGTVAYTCGKERKDIFATLLSTEVKPPDSPDAPDKKPLDPAGASGEAAPPKRSKKGIGSAGKLPPLRASECHPRAIAITAAGRPTGQNHPRARWPDATVAKARALAASGMGHKRIGKALGVAYSTVWGWLHGKRPPALRVAVYARWRRTAARTAAAAAKRSAP